MTTNKETAPKRAMGPPLWITPLWETEETEGIKEVAEGRYRILKRLVSRTPNSTLSTDYAEIETCLEEFIGHDGRVLWRRIAVRGVPEGILHASFRIRDDDVADTSEIDKRSKLNMQDPILCWAAFPDRPEHELLFFLARPDILYFWDVYPSTEGDQGESFGGGEGHAVTLPFEARAVFPLEGNGVLIQRQETFDDLLQYEASKNSDFSLKMSSKDDDEDEEFVLANPPRPVRLGSMMATPSSVDMMASPSPQLAQLEVPVASCYSLQHPLEDALPVSVAQEGLCPNLVSDVQEKVLFVGTVKWTDQEELPHERVEYVQPICVTYHTYLKRHAVWALEKAPPPPPTLPLWKISEKQRKQGQWDDTLGLMMHDPHVVDEDDLELLGVVDADASRHEAASRNEALADALGVKKSSRKGDEAGRIGRRRSRLSGAAPSSYLTPPPGSKKPRSSLAGKESSKNDLSSLNAEGLSIDTSHTNTALLESTAYTKFSALHTSVSRRLIYEDDVSQETPTNEAVDVFLASDLSGSGMLTLCLLCAAGADANANPMLLRCLSLQPRRVIGKEATMNTSVSSAHFLSAEMCMAVPCICAVPVHSTPTPHCFRPLPTSQPTNGYDEGGFTSTDILLLARKSANESNELLLYREKMYIVHCDLKGFEMSGHAMRNAVHDRFDLLVGKGDRRSCVRSKLSLQFSHDPLVDSTLAAIDASVFSHQRVEVEKVVGVLKLRADTHRLVQLMVADAHHQHANNHETTSWLALSAILTEIIQLELFGKFAMDDDAESESGGTDSYWSAVLQSDYHREYLSEKEERMFLGFARKEDLPVCTYLPHAVAAHEMLAALAPTSLPVRSASKGSRAGETFSLPSSLIFDQLHLLYEEMKLARHLQMSTSVGLFLSQLCYQIDFAIANKRSKADKPDLPNMRDFLDHYKRDIGPRSVLAVQDKVGSMGLRSRRAGEFRSALTQFDSPPCFLSWIDGLMKHGCGDHENASSFFDRIHSSEINAACKLTRTLHRAFSVLFSADAAKSPVEKDRNVVDVLVQEGIMSITELRDQLPVGVCVPLLEVLQRCREDPGVKHASSAWSPAAWALIGRQDLSKSSRGSTITEMPSLSTENSAAFEDLDKDGLVPMEKTCAMLFSNDNRVREIGRLLRSSRPVFLKVPRAVEVSDHDYERLKQDRLLMLIRRSLALPLGRGMFTFGTMSPVPAEPLPLPELSISGRIPPNNANIALDISNCPVEFKVWPEFHNAVAAGLRLPCVKGEGFSTIGEITRTWIVYNRTTGGGASRPEATSGAQGNIDPEESDNQSSHAFGGLLMALGLRGHLSRLALTDIYEYLTTDNNTTTTVGMLLGLAAEKRGTCDTSVTKMLCLHIPSLFPQSFASYDVARPAQTAAVSGIGLLYLGSSHRMMTEFLLDEIGRRPESETDPSDREAYTLSCGIALGMINLAKGKRGVSGDNGGGVGAGLSDLDLEARLHTFAVGGVDFSESRRRQEAADRANGSGVGSGEGERCSRVFEGTAINTDVTAPAATLALGLMYLKSGNQAVAAGLALPNTHFLLEYTRPDLLLLRVLARSLILWDDIIPSHKWIKEQVPTVVRKASDLMRRASEIARVFPDFVPDAASVSEKKAALRSQIGPDVDKRAVRQMYACTVAGACFSIGLRFAGTGDNTASKILIERLLELKMLRDGIDPVSTALKPEQPILEMCLGCVSLALGLVNAGTGDLESLRVLKMLRWRCDETIRYGHHMAYGAAIGLLFLGGGSCTVGREVEDISFLLMSFFPRFPATTTDNQYHLQALRHCYALSVKHRLLQAVDADTGETAVLPVEIGFQDGALEPHRLTVPCLLLNTDCPVRELSVTSQHYYPMTLELSRGTTEQFGKIFFVKKRGGFRGLSTGSEMWSTPFLSTRRSPPDLIRSITEDPTMTAYAQYFCDTSSAGREPLGSGSWVTQFSERTLLDCLGQDRADALPLLMSLRSALVRMQRDRTSSSLTVWDVRLIRNYYKGRGRCIRLESGARRLINSDLATYFSEMVERFLSASSLGEKDVLVYMQSGELRSSEETGELFGAFLVYSAIPFPSKQGPLLATNDSTERVQ